MRPTALVPGPLGVESYAAPEIGTGVPPPLKFPW